MSYTRKHVFTLGVVTLFGVSAAFADDEILDIIGEDDVVTLNAALSQLPMDAVRQYRFGRGYTLVHAAMSYRNSAVAISLIHFHGGDIDAQDIDGRTPLHHAIDSDDIFSARALVNLGARTDIPNSANLTAQEFCKGVLEQTSDHTVCRYLEEQRTD